MSVATAVTDFADLYTDLQNRVRDATSVTATENIAKRYINQSLYDMHIVFGETFPWSERNAVLRTRPDYTTGTITVDKGSTTVTGVSTAWETADDFSINNVRAGGKIVFDSQVDVYEVSSTTTTLVLELTEAYVGADLAAGTSYEYFEDEYDLASDFLKPIDTRSFSTGIPIEIVGRTEFRRRYVRNNRPGRPTVATIVDRPPQSNTTPRRRVVLHQPPDDTYRIPYSYVTSNLAVLAAGTAAAGLVNDDDEPIVPLRYRHVIVLGALATWYRDLKDDARSQEVAAEHAGLMNRIVSDNDIGSSKPTIAPRIAMYRRRAGRPWKAGRGRYDVNGAFDRMEF